MGILLVVLVFAVAWLGAILGGLGVGGLGRDSRGLDPREHPENRPWRSLLSR